MCEQRAVQKELFEYLVDIAKMVCAVCISLSLISCGGSNSDTPDYSISATVIGLEGSGLVLQNNAVDGLIVSADGIYTFDVPIERGGSYAVTIQSQPDNPSQTCTVNDGTGLVSNADITGVTVVCSTNSYIVGGTVSALNGTGLVLQNNAGDDIGVDVNGDFVFTSPVASGANYAVTVKTQPTNLSQTCTVNNASGTMTNTDINDVAVVCSTNSYIVGGTVNGLAGNGLVLQNNAGDDLNIDADGNFTFSTPVASGAAYTVTVKTQPTNLAQTCTVNNASGTATDADIANVAVICSTNSYSVNAIVSGLDSIVPNGSGLVLQNNAGDDLVVTTNGSFPFSTPVASGADYLITVRTQPSTLPAQSCQVTASSGTVSDSDVSVAITCGPAYVLPTTSTEISMGAKGVLVDGDTAYITTDTEFRIVNVSDPLNPSVVGTVAHGFSDLRVEPHVHNNGIVWCIRSFSGGSGLATYVSGIDVSDPANPVVRGTLTLQTGSSLLSSASALYEGYLLVHDYSRNLIYVIDVSNPDAPVTYSQWGVPNMVNGGPGLMTVEGSLLYLPCGESGLLNIYDLNDLQAVVLVSSANLGAEVYGPLAKKGNYVYLHSSVYGGPKYFNVVDVSNLSSPILVSRQDSTGYPKLKNGKLFTFDGNKITAYSLIDPENPVVENSSLVGTPSPLQLYLLSYPSSAWVGNYLIGMTFSDSALTNGARALEFPVY